MALLWSGSCKAIARRRASRCRGIWLAPVQSRKATGIGGLSFWATMAALTFLGNMISLDG